MEKITFREMQIKDIPQIIALYPKVFGGTPMPRKQYEWFLLKTPLKKNVVYVGENEGGEIISHVSAISVRMYNHDNSEINGAMTGNAFIRYDYRNKELNNKRYFEAMMNEFGNKVSERLDPDFTFGFMGLAHYEIGNASINYRKIEDTKIYNKVISKNHTGSGTYQFEEIKNIMQINNLISKFKYHTQAIRIKRDIQFLKWRYLDSPVFNYCFIKIILKKTNTSIGLAVVNKFQNHIFLMEIFSDSPENFEKCFISLEDYTAQQGYASIRTWAPQKSLAYKLMKERKYQNPGLLMDPPRDHNFEVVTTYIPMLTKIDMNSSTSYWFSLGDYDVF